MQMPIRSLRVLGGLAVLILPVLLLACGGGEEGDGGKEAVLDAAGVLDSTVPEPLARRIKAMAAAAARLESSAELTVDYPLDESVFPPEFIPPTFLWHDPEPRAVKWLVEIAFSADEKPITALVPGAPPPKGELDMEAFSETNEPYEGTDYQNSATSWTPTAPLWAEVKRRSAEAPATITFTGFTSSEPASPVSRGSVRIVTSKDPVGAPIFYRDVPLMPSVGEGGRIKPLGDKALPIIGWRLRDVSKPESKLVLKGMSSCGNCHSFSLDGKTLGMDVDGPDGDKGMYAIKTVSKKMVIDYDDVITWNSFPGKPKGHRTIGFLSRMSPDGRFVATTVNEALYVANFTDYKFLQVFYPTRGILAFYSRSDGKIRALPGADDPAFVHCSPVWSPDGSQLVFARAPATDPDVEDRPMPTYPNDPNELPIRFDLYRMPFDGGNGGKPVPVEGASRNGSSNSFPKISPDGRWIVFVKCRNGLLMRPDSRLWIVPLEGGQAREMRCNTSLMNSWHSFSPNSRWMVFSSKTNTPYTQAFLTHIDEDGNDSPAILVPNCTAANRAVNLPEFLNASADELDSIEVPVVRHHIHLLSATRSIKAGRFEEAVVSLEKALKAEPTFARAHAAMGFALSQLRRVEEAIPHFERSVESDPRNASALLNFGLALLETGRPSRALVPLEALVEFAPSYPGAMQVLSDARSQVEELRVEFARAREALAQSPGDGRLHLRLCTLLSGLGQTKDALMHLGRAVDLLPDDPRPASQLAWALATDPDDGIRDGVRAVALAKRAVELTEGKRPEPLDALAAAFAETGRYDEAVSTAERALSLAPKSSLLVPGIERRLQLYRKRQPFRVGANR